MLLTGLDNDNNENNKLKNLPTLVYERIKSQIVLGELLPGAPLSERPLAKELGVSRTPVREAINRLVQEGWVNMGEYRRTTISEIKEKDVIELIMLREMIEPFALERVIKVGQPALLAGALVQIVKEMEQFKSNHIALLEKDLYFHTTIVNFAGIEKLSHIWLKLKDEILRHAIYGMHSQRQPDEVIEEHRMIIDALWNENPETALKYLEDHHKKVLNSYKTKHFLESEVKVKIRIE